MSFAIIPRQIGRGPIRLRRLSIADMASLTDKLDGLSMSGKSYPALISYLLNWYWFKRNYPVAYCILLNDTLVGFIGISNFIPKEAGEISLIIFDEKMRHKGIGTAAFNLLKEDIQRRRLLKTIYARIEQGNPRGVKFWRNMGFFPDQGVQYLEQIDKKGRHQDGLQKKYPKPNETVRFVLRL